MLSVCLLFLLLSRNIDAVIEWSRLDMYPSNAPLGDPLEIKLTFKTTTAITDANQIRLNMPGFTRGIRNNNVGANLHDQTLAKRYPAGLWNVKWFEGTVANSFHDSYFLMNPVQGTAGVSSGDVVTIIVDKAFEIKANCGTVSTQLFTLTDEALGTTNIAGANRTSFTGGCYFTDTRVDVHQPLDKTWMKITVQFRPAMNIMGGENVTFNMAGFTNSNFTGKAYHYGTNAPGQGDGADITNVQWDFYDIDSDARFHAYWTEGTYEKHLPGFTNSTLRLKVEDGQTLTAGTLYTAVVDRLAAKIGTVCSLPEDYDKITISTDATAGAVVKARVMHTDSVGNGCKQLGFCSGHGKCNFCTEQCTCDKEYGGAGAIVGIDIKQDCSERVCPAGYSWGSLPTASNLGHPLEECSGAGICERGKGVCRCFEGFGGAKCDRRTCPEFNSEVCSGHGTCLSMRQLSMKPDALPLSDPWDYKTTGISYPIYGGGREGNIIVNENNVTWDERFLHLCHCDSSWPVGLGPGETQVPEFFGAACNLRHCPSGDDPLTTVDETNCTGVTAAGGKSVGQKGNLCHVECSNRGLCDYETGTCECFKGFWGTACEILKDIDPTEGEE
eukprot:CAMPEP_0118654522 /NCGR_PEP_ID=MMETSP0785-20121206/12440_1 /TAXON_ID=91992 /ORGANISM="Bolidomonas pacifica, Strain CCMP 1866" /LENGTH=611 /DNA_ID=CAMNT_0006547199 /DNA_START=136 /DNA_END=1971 /DNA_ORIENTATION=+